ncbi:hypothetical protein [Dermacoccus nishinomiyaensis]|uniref:hypothetical protein n=1 Tax=Dermacoccus nishinomiyaensis TaxID=1274 RepID=UPI0011A9D949|nr:hypothetical protein [Dermacoccus nishinomiyaensis]
MRIDNDLWDFWDRQLSSMREEYSRSPAQRDLDELLIALSRGAVYCKTVDAPAALENSLELDHTGAALVKDYRFRIYAADEILRQAAVQPENFLPYQVRQVEKALFDESAAVAESVINILALVRDPGSTEPLERFASLRQGHERWKRLSSQARWAIDSINQEEGQRGLDGIGDKFLISRDLGSEQINFGAH